MQAKKAVAGLQSSKTLASEEQQLLATLQRKEAEVTVLELQARICAEEVGHLFNAVEHLVSVFPMPSTAAIGPFLSV
jgi:hypothetical protein